MKHILGRLAYLFLGAAASIALIPHFYNACPEGMTCWEGTGVPIAAEHSLDGTILKIQWMDSEQMPEGTQAYAQWQVDYKNNLSFCVVYAQWPRHSVGDIRMEALGHELLHCLTGEFHP